MIVNMKEVLTSGTAIPQFNINNLEWTKFILEECEIKKNPVILGVSESAIEYMGGYHVVVKMIEGLLQDLKITIPVVVHLDHGKSYEACLNAINAGFTSVMIDASNYELNKNIRITKSVVEYAHKRNVTVEGEIGFIGLATTEPIYTEVKNALKFVKETNIDALAPAVGSLHGLYINEPKINFERIKEIKEVTKVPIVLHGGTGIPDIILKKAIQAGISKVNINTALQVTWSKEVRTFLNENPDVYDPRKIIGSGKNSIKKVIDNYLEILNGANE